jgi:hypothetical protein
LFQKLKDSKKNPVFMLKHIKDIRSPIAVTQQKHAARKASSVISNDTVATQGHYKSGSASKANRPSFGLIHIIWTALNDSAWLARCRIPFPTGQSAQRGLCYHIWFISITDYEFNSKR